MKSLQNIDSLPAGLPLLADDIVEFHAARLLLLVRLCGTGGRINGLTKLAKLDFFVRYPRFFATACDYLKKDHEPVKEGVESSMVRYHYGPWDRRYYHVISYLEARELILVVKDNNSFSFVLTPAGKGAANRLASEAAFSEMANHMAQVKKVLGGKNGTTLKNLIYKLFDSEVAQRGLGEVIEQ